ncbi:aminotransferase class III-fold pyridoxal phosphate-dependent enzyme [Lentzea sp. NPDC004782]|uniref:aminotransferase class III-fold pyridoxal phosphate-dependent enzyme n=1 Tax=Lentzea sp. NPDC004782 TaxID=3154458 RepID=UPI0033ABF898
MLNSRLSATLPVVHRGAGVYVWDTAGKCYLDGSSGSVAAVLGHAHPNLLRAMSGQAEQISHVYRGMFANRPAEELARLLLSQSGGDYRRVQFANSGSEAVEIALKIAIQYWQERGRPTKTGMLSRRHSYHGNTMGALSLSGHAGRRSRFETVLHDYPALPAPTSDQDFADFENAVERLGPENLAAVVVEPVVGGAALALVPPDGYHRRLRSLCDEYELLLIADEVMTGVHRTGPLLAMDDFEVDADLTVLGKGLGGGCIPLSAVMVSGRVIDGVLAGSGRLDTGGHTYASGPLAAAVGLEVMRTIQSDGLAAACRGVGEQLGHALVEMGRSHPAVREVRGTGMLWGIELAPEAPARAAERLVEAAAEAGLIIYLAGDDGIEGVLVAPPLIMELPHVDELVGKLDLALTAIERTRSAV